MKHERILWDIPPARTAGVPAIDQGIVNGWQISWNPDDNRYYVEHSDKTAAATFTNRNNARYWARTHAPVHMAA